MNIIEELFYGNLDPNGKVYARKPQFNKAMDVIDRNEEMLIQLLEGKEKSRLIDLTNAYGEVLGISSVENFMTGFQMGARFMLDTFVMEPNRILKDNT